ncbi:hypothetical protein [Plantactinospora sp. B5E13]|uniref:hypothetical protein n=1 Tax=unclassified Plantactinospora TaxID=2631981 RepID=UPI00325D76A0
MTALGPAVRLAHEIIIAHAEGRDCLYCQDTWCLGAEWALGVAALNDRPPPSPDGTALVTVVARQVLAAHWPQPAGGCAPCGVPDCDRADLATAWLGQVGEPVPETAEQVTEAVPSDADLHRITGM